MSPIRVLVVDDNADAVQAMVALLEFLRFDARGSLSGEECLEMAESWKPQVFLIDLGMPMSGYEVARRIREIKGLEGAPLIAWTAFDSEETRRRVQVAGFVDHLVKPVDLKRLRSALAAVAPSDLLG